MPPRAAPVIRLFLTTGLALMVAMIAVPMIRDGLRERAMRDAIASEDITVRAEAIAYYSRLIDPADPLSRPRFFAIPGLDAVVEGASDTTLLDLHSAFGGVRDFRERFPAHHLRAIRLSLENSDDPDLALHALTQLASTPLDATREETASLLSALASHPDQSVRAATVEHACWRLGPGALPIVERGLRDPSPLVARTSWLALPHLDPPGGYPANYTDLPVEVAEAVLLASVLLGGESTIPLLDRASSEPALAPGVAYGRALLASSDEPATLAIIDEFSDEPIDALRAREKGIEDRAERARVRLAITAREPTPEGVDEALLLAADGLLTPRDTLGALLHAGRARSVVRVLLDSSTPERTIGTGHRAILTRFFDAESFLIPVPTEIPEGDRARTLAYDALRAWWMCVGNRLAFDRSARVYTFED